MGGANARKLAIERDSRDYVAHDIAENDEIDYAQANIVYDDDSLDQPQSQEPETVL